jgi:hypothetical protein
MKTVDVMSGLSGYNASLSLELLKKKKPEWYVVDTLNPWSGTQTSKYGSEQGMHELTNQIASTSTLGKTTITSKNIPQNCGKDSC